MKNMCRTIALILLIVPLTACKKTPGPRMTVNPPDMEWLFLEIYNENNDKILEVTVTDLGREKIDMAMPDRVGSYAAKIVENSELWILIGDRFRIHLDAGPGIVAPDLKNTKRLKEFALLFNLAGLARVDSGDRLTSRELRKYIPKFRIIRP